MLTNTIEHDVLFEYMVFRPLFSAVFFWFADVRWHFDYKH